MTDKSRAAPLPTILAEYRRRRGNVDPALISDAERVFEALLAHTPAETIMAAMEASRFNRPDEYQKTIRVLKGIADERNPR